MAADENFLRRWSRLKQRAAQAQPSAGAPAPNNAAPPAAEALESSPLPPVASLGFESDFRSFLAERVEESLRRAALKKLFHSEHFKQMDGLDVYVDDYSICQPIPEEMLSRLSHAREMLFGSPDAVAQSPSTPAESLANGPIAAVDAVTATGASDAALQPVADEGSVQTQNSLLEESPRQ